MNVGGNFVGRDQNTENAQQPAIQPRQPLPNQQMKAIDPLPQPQVDRLEDNKKANLLALLHAHRNNLLQLQRQKTVYPIGEEPLRLQQQIQDEENEIARIQGELR